MISTAGPLCKKNVSSELLWRGKDVRFKYGKLAKIIQNPPIFTEIPHLHIFNYLLILTPFLLEE